MNKLTSEELKILRDISLFKYLGITNTGRDVKMRCPIHNEKTPSFTLYGDEKRGYHCFGCKAHGYNAIDFVMNMGLTFPEAVEELTKVL